MVERARSPGMPKVAASWAASESGSSAAKSRENDKARREGSIGAGSSIRYIGGGGKVALVTRRLVFGGTDEEVGG